jgi:hypothetical protein
LDQRQASPRYRDTAPTPRRRLARRASPSRQGPSDANLGHVRCGIAGNDRCEPARPKL